MRAAVLEAYHRPLALVERPDPEITRPDQVLLRIAGAGVCARSRTSMRCSSAYARATSPAAR
jgi:D-arabinose 1-dehydrogenase-like Zn-dependent alcohol dehydrogenase